MKNDFSKQIYLKMWTSLGTQTILVVNNSGSLARISEPHISPDNPHQISFTYQELDNQRQARKKSRTITKKFDKFKVYKIIKTMYGQRKIYLDVLDENKKPKTIALLGNSNSPACLNNLVLTSPTTIQYDYYDLKNMKGRLLKKTTNFPISEIVGFHYGDLLFHKPDETTKNAFLNFLDVLIKEEVPYFMIGSTMLGALRCHGLLPEAKDLTIGIQYGDFNKLFNATIKTFRFYLNDSASLHLAKRLPYGTISVYDLQIKRVIAEIFYFKKSPNSPPHWKPKLESLKLSPTEPFYWIAAGEKASSWPLRHKGAHNIPESWLYPLQQEFFYNRMVNLPKEADKLAKNLFGENCLTHHNTNTAVKYALDKGYTEEPLEDFSPL